MYIELRKMWEKVIFIYWRYGLEKQKQAFSWTHHSRMASISFCNDYVAYLFLNAQLIISRNFLVTSAWAWELHQWHRLKHNRRRGHAAAEVIAQRPHEGLERSAPVDTVPVTWIVLPTDSAWLTAHCVHCCVEAFNCVWSSVWTFFLYLLPTSCILLNGRASSKKMCIYYAATNPHL